jgi:hypothetical protein
VLRSSVACSAVTFHVGALRGVTPNGGAGVVDHRLARRFLVSEYRKGRLARHQVCDAHPELIRAARALGEETRVDCPICEDDKLVLLTYVFGPRLPAHGRCITAKSELDALSRRTETLTAYVVEVCRSCTWHHLLRVVPIAGRARSR